MRTTASTLLLLLISLLAPTVHAGAQQLPAGEMKLLLQHRAPEVRSSSARILGVREARWAVRPLIDLLDDENETVRRSAHRALRKITGKSFDLNQGKWETWYREDGRTAFSPDQVTSPAIDYGVRRFLDPLVVSVGSLALLLLFVLTFAIIGGYKMKQLKEVMREAEEYLDQAEEVTKSSDKFSEEVEQKKVEMREYLSNLKEEKEGELERHTELLEENSAQRIREEISSLREQAEKEVEHTMNDLHEDVRLKIEREIKELRDDIKKELSEIHGEFEEEAHAQRMFLEASLYDLTDKPDEALEKYDRVIDMKPDHHLAIQRKARVLNRKEQFEMALQQLQKALDHSPESPSLLYDIARTYALMGRKGRMLEFLKKSISIESEYKDEALNDDAFESFWNDREFKDLAEG